MTLMEALHRVDSLKPNNYTNPEKIKWLSILDGIIKTKIIDTHEGGESVSFNGYEEYSDLTQELLVPAPFDEIYIHWLTMQIDYTNGEYGKYNNSMQLYNAAYTEYAKFYNKSHKPIAATRFMF